MPFWFSYNKPSSKQVTNTLSKKIKISFFYIKISPKELQFALSRISIDLSSNAEMEISEKIMPPMIFNTNNSKRTIVSKNMIENKLETVKILLNSTEQNKNKFDNYQHVLAEKNFNLSEVVGDDKDPLPSHRFLKYANSDNIGLQQNYLLRSTSSNTSILDHTIKLKQIPFPSSPMFDNSPIKIEKRQYQMKFNTNRSTSKDSRLNQGLIVNHHNSYQLQQPQQQQLQQPQQLQSQSQSQQQSQSQSQSQQQSQLQSQSQNGDPQYEHHEQPIKNSHGDNISQLNISSKDSLSNVSESFMNPKINFKMKLLNTKLPLGIQTPEKRLISLTLESISSPLFIDDNHQINKRIM